MTSRIYGYDLDGVLAKAPPLAEKTWFKMNGPERIERRKFLNEWYESAPVLLQNPQTPFHVLTARKGSEVTLKWLKENLGIHADQVHFFIGTRTYDNVAKFKSEEIKRLCI